MLKFDIQIAHFPEYREWDLTHINKNNKLPTQVKCQMS